MHTIKFSCIWVLRLDNIRLPFKLNVHISNNNGFKKIIIKD